MTRALKAHADGARLRNLERALRDERLGLMVVATIALRNARDPEALVAHIETTAAAAATRRKVVRPQARAALADAHALFRNALAMERGRPQELLEPDVGHVPPREVSAVADGQDPGQLSLMPVAELAQARTAIERAVLDRVVEALEDRGPSTDDELVAAVASASASTVRSARVELARRGRIVPTGDRRLDDPIYDLAENTYR